MTVIIHRAMFGSYERFVGILIEHCDGRLPIWLAPEPVRVLSISADQLGYAATIADRLARAGARGRAWTN